MANQTLINLKKIYSIENDGTILEILRGLRNSKANLEAFGKAIVKRRKEASFKEVEIKKEVVAQTQVKEPEKFSVAPEKPVEARKPELQQKPRDNGFKPNKDRVFSNQPSQNNNFRKFNQNGERQFAPRPQNGAQRPFRENNFNKNGQQNRPFNKPQGQGAGKGLNFVSTKQNNFKTFKAQPEFVPPAAPERTFGNKNKSPQRNKSFDQDNKKPAFNKRDDSRRSVIAYGEDGFEETIMGSRKTIKPKKKQEKVINPIVTHAVLTSSEISVKDLSEKIGIPVAEIVKKLMMLGIMGNINSTIDFDTAELVLSDFGVTLELNKAKTMEEMLQDATVDQDDKNMVKRPPVVAVMGHVDHGKTSLLDAFRSSHVVEGEAGGITQAIGAYQITFNGEKITFIDTPGHAAFTAMRARGAQVTDVAIIVVAADDGVMPQTIEAINHAKAANVTIIVAVNKIDKQGANVDRVKQEMVEHGLVPEEWGGDTIFVPVSARNHQNIDELLENVLLSADILQLKANPDKQAFGTIIEAKLDKNKGPVATLLVQRGTLRQGDTIISGTSMGHVRTMTDDKGRSIKEAGPSTPVEITGMPEVPEAGEVFNAVKDEKLARQLVEKRKDQMREKTLNASSKVSLQDLFSQIQSGDVKELNIVVKADVQGSVEAVKQSLEKLSTDEVKVKVIHGGVGAVTESDVTLAQVSNAIIIGFNVRPGAGIAESAEAAGVDVRLYRIIYDAIDDVKAAMIGMLDPEFKEVVTGHVEIRQTFKVSGVGTIAGCYVTDGKIVRNSDVRIVRDGIVIFEGKLASLKRFKDDVKEVQQGFECGLSFERFNDIKEGDVVEAFVMEEIKRG